MPASARYDVLVVGGGLAGIAVATVLAKRGRRVAVVDPRPGWGGAYADQRVGDITVSWGPRAVVGHERTGWADAYFEAIGLSLSILVREGATFKREPIQLLWGGRRITLAPDRAEFVEELRREYRVGEADVRALLADFDAVYEVLALRLEPSPLPETGSSWPRLRRQAAARAFAARFGALASADYLAARKLSRDFAPYLDAWRTALETEGALPGTWLFLAAQAHRGVVTLPAGRAGVCRLLVSRFESLGGEVVRTPLTAVGISANPFVETDGRRLSSRAMIVNSPRQPGSGPAQAAGAGAVTTAVFSVPSACVPDAMATYLLAVDPAGGNAWALSRRRAEAPGGSSRDVITASCRGSGDARTVGRLTDAVLDLMPFAAGQFTVAGTFRDDQAPEPADPKFWESVSWKSRGLGWLQASRAPVWWLGDVSAPWLGGTDEYRAALAVDRFVRVA